MRHLKRGIRFASVVIFATIASAIPKSPVYASSSGCSSFIGDATCITVNGPGLDVISMKGNFHYSSGLCYWHYTFFFYNTVDKHPHGAPYTSATGPVSKKCDGDGSWTKTWKVPFQAQQGSVCAALYRRDRFYGPNIYVDRACELITP